MKKEWANVAWRAVVICCLVWIGYELHAIRSSQYYGPSDYDSHTQAIDKVRKSVEEVNSTLSDIARYGAGWRRP